MALPKTIQNNLRFLVVEVKAQLELLESYFDRESLSIAQKIIDRSGYSYNLRLRIQNTCMQNMSLDRKTDAISLRAVSAIAGDLEKITELCRDNIYQLGYLSRNHKLNLKNFLGLLKQIIKGIKLVEDALLDSNTTLALKLGGNEKKLDKSYKRLLQKYTKQLKSKKNTHDLVTGLFVAHGIEQMGDALLNISDAIISSNLGQPMDLQRFQSLQETLDAWVQEVSLEELEIKSVAETKSGSGISSINYVDENSEQQLAIYKDGEKKKLKEELDGVERWHKIYPGVAPQILTYKKTGDNAALLIEHLQGDTFEKLVINGPMKSMNQSMRALKKTLYSIWTETKKDTQVNAKFIQQTKKRLPDIYAIHPSFQAKEKSLCGVEIESFEQLLSSANDIETQYNAPFSVFIHGDFNVDNILYDNQENKVNFIDLHRSSRMDYIQDISVFMVSNYRLQVFDNRVRQRINRQVLEFYSLAKQFSVNHRDHSFDLRLAFGLARSFATSTRFILDKSMARRMFYRALYILDLIVHFDKNESKNSNFILPVKELFSE